MKRSFKSWCNFLVISSLLLFSVSIPRQGFSQDEDQGSLDNLQHCKGFGKITLGSNIKILPATKLDYLDGDPSPDIDSCFRYVYKDEDILALTNSISLDLVGFRAYKNKIVNIYLFFRREDGYKILKALTAVYGPSTQKNGDFTYSWTTNAVNLNLMYKPDEDNLGVAVFTLNNADLKTYSNSTIARVSQ